MSERHEIELPLDADDSLEALAHLAELWDAEWHRLGTGGKLTLPVAAGVRYGIVESAVSTENRGRRDTTVVVQEEKSTYQLHWPAVAILAVGAAGGLLTVFAPFVARPGDDTLAAMLVLGFFMLIVTWFLVVSKVKNRGIPEFLENLREMVSDEEGRAD